MSERLEGVTSLSGAQEHLADIIRMTDNLGGDGVVAEAIRAHALAAQAELANQVCRGPLGGEEDESHNGY